MRTTQVFCALSAFSVFSGAFGLAVTNSTALPPNKTSPEPAATSLPYNPILANGAVNLGIAQDAYDKATAFVAGLSNEQKISIINGGALSGNVTWNAYQLRDGEAGVNLQFFVSGFTMVHALTMTWNRDLYAAQFKAVGDEFYAMGFQIIDGPLPGALGRVPWAGRQPEGFSPDPYLTGIALGKAVAAMNSAGVIAGARHLLLNEQETHRMASFPNIPNYSSNADDKTIQELYLWPWGDGVNSGLMAVMCGMNRVNGSQSCENNDVAAGYLKTKLGFPGFVYPDVDSQMTPFGSVNGGLDLGSSQIWSQRIMLQGLANGRYTQERLDDMAVRNLMGYYFVGLDDGLQPPPVASETEYRDVRGNHSDLIRQVSNEAIVLLKNSNVTGLGLPLSKPRTVSLYGAHAGPAMTGPNFGFNPISGPAEVFEGHLASGTGSGQLSLPYLVTPFQALSDRAMKDNSMIWWIFNNTYASSGGGPFIVSNTTDAPTPSPTGGGGGGGVGVPGAGHFGGGTGEYPSFQNYAKNSDVCLVFINADSGEGSDRSNLSDGVQDKMVTTIAENCNNTIVIVNTAGPRILDAWIEHPHVTAVLYAGLLGQNSGQSIADVLYGDVNPSGKLAHTIAKEEADYPAKVCLTAQCEFTEGTFIDYRWFDAQNISVRYPFGHGLSYTEFTYGDATASITNSSALASQYPTGGMGLGGESDLWGEVISVSLTIKNTGAVTGAEVAQLYVSFPAEAEQPVRILRGFEKSSIAAGASTTVTFSLRRRDISYWNVVAQKWTIAAGEYTFSVGSSSRDIRTTTTLKL